MLNEILIQLLIKLLILEKILEQCFEWFLEQKRSWFDFFFCFGITSAGVAKIWNVSISFS